MKNLRVVIYISGTIILAILLGIFLNGKINSKLDQLANQNPEQNQSTQTSTTNPTTADQTAATPNDNQATTTPNANPTDTAVTQVTTINLSADQSYFTNVVGTIKSQNTVAVFPTLSAAIKKVNFVEGDYVKTGDIIAELTGSNLTEHATQKQLKIAQTTYDNSKAALENLIKTNNESLKTAQLMVQSALSQASAIPYDLEVMTQSQEGIQNSLDILQNSLDQTQQKNARDLEKTRSDIDDLVATLNNAQEDRAHTISQINDLQSQIDNLPPDQTAALTQQMTALKTALTAQDKAINDLYTAVDKARYGYSTQVNAAQLAENQIQAQLATANTQLTTSQLTEKSTETKLGYTGDSSDALRIAEQTFNATQTQLQAAIEAAQNSLKLSKINLDLAKDQVAGLQVKAPFSGLITSLNLSPGQTVSPQASIAEIVNPQEFQLEISVDPGLADQISLSSPAQIELAGKWLEVPIKSIAPKIDEKTKQVKVVLQMPNIFFRNNQVINAKLPLSPNSSASSLVLPLDAVTIATESQFVYINDQGKAKRVEVKTGQIHGDYIEILDGLKPQDQVILAGSKSLIDGQAIQVIEVK